MPTFLLFLAMLLLNSAHVREKDKALARSVMVLEWFPFGKGQRPAFTLPAVWCARW